MVQAELQESVKELTKSRKKYQEAETMAQAVREKAELDAKYEPVSSSIIEVLLRFIGKWFRRCCLVNTRNGPLQIPITIAQ